MKGKILEINHKDALVTFENGTHTQLSLSNFPAGSKSGDCVNIHKLNLDKKSNEKHMNNIF